MLNPALLLIVLTVFQQLDLINLQWHWISLHCRMFNDISDKHIHHMWVKQNIASAECNKVISYILGETELFTVFENTDKLTHFNPYSRSQLKVFTIYGNDKMPKTTIKKQKKSEHKFDAIKSERRESTLVKTCAKLICKNPVRLS